MLLIYIYYTIAASLALQHKINFIDVAHCSFMYSANIYWAPSVCWAPVSAFQELTDKHCGLESWFAKSCLQEGPLQRLPDRGHSPWISIAASSPCVNPFPTVLAKGEAIHCGLLPHSTLAGQQRLTPVTSMAGRCWFCEEHGQWTSTNLTTREAFTWVSPAWSQGALVSLVRLLTTAQWQVTHPWAIVFLIHSE